MISFILYLHVLLLCHSSFFFFLIFRRPPRSTLDRSSAASDVYKRQGYLNAAIDMANEFLPANKLIVYTEGKAYPRQDANSVGNGSMLKGKVIVLIDEGSASASEIVTGALPVSYTHLRAHETVLDLVCRLLLEKKKTTHT